MRLTIPYVLLIIFIIAVPTVVAFAETVIPLKGQSPEQIQVDIYACKTQESSTAAAPPTTTSPPPASTTQGGRMKGAAAGAVAGAAAAQVRGNQYDAYDKVDDDVKQEYRQESAKDAARAGAAIGGVKQRQTNRKQEAQQAQAAPPADTSQQAYNACMSGRGYSIQN